MIASGHINSMIRHNFPQKLGHLIPFHIDPGLVNKFIQLRCTGTMALWQVCLVANCRENVSTCKARLVIQRSFSYKRPLKKSNWSFFWCTEKAKKNWRPKYG
jgi:hypothetical protein